MNVTASTTSPRSPPISKPTSTSTAGLVGLRSAGGRVVKPIGDEVPYTACDELSACTIALTLAKILTDHPVVPRCVPVWQAVP